MTFNALILATLLLFCTPQILQHCTASFALSLLSSQFHLCCKKKVRKIMLRHACMDLYCHFPVSFFFFSDRRVYSLFFADSFVFVPVLCARTSPLSKCTYSCHQRHKHELSSASTVHEDARAINAFAASYVVKCTARRIRQC